MMSTKKLLTMIAEAVIAADALLTKNDIKACECVLHKLKFKLIQERPRTLHTMN